LKSQYLKVLRQRLQPDSRLSIEPVSEAR
jgi:hypothetical protein